MKSGKYPLTLIHVGLPKCASSFMQAKVLPRMTGNYCNLTVELLENVNSATFSPELFLNMVDDYAKKATYRNRLNRLISKNHRLEILSSEFLSGRHSTTVGQECDGIITANNLKLAYPNAKILMMIREQKKYLLSAYAFRVACYGFETSTFEEWLTRKIKQGIIEKLKYDILAKHYIDLFGKENVLILPMEMIYMDSNRFYKMLLSFAKVASFEIPRKSQVNPSPKGDKILSLHRSANKMLAPLSTMAMKFGTEKVRNGLYRFKSSVINPFLLRCYSNESSLSVPEEIIEKYADDFRESNQFISMVSKVDLTEFGYL